MGIYEKHILPKVIDTVCRSKPNMKQREKVIPLAKGKVLEIGIGSGLNLPFYQKNQVKEVIGLDPSKELWSKNKVDINELEYDFRFLEAVAEDIPVDSGEFDAVVLTYTLCTLPDVTRSISEMKRVLKNDGVIIFSEHGIAPDKGTRFWQHAVNPVWKRLGGGCNLTRNIPKILEDGSFRISELHQQYIPGWKPASYNYWGLARK